MRLCGAPAGVLAARARAWADGDNALALNATRSLLLAALATVGRERSLRAVLDAPRKLLDVGVTVRFVPPPVASRASRPTCVPAGHVAV